MGEREREERECLPALQQDSTKDVDCGIEEGGDFYTVLGMAS